MDGSSLPLLTDALIIFGVLGVAVYAMRKFHQHPARVAGVILAVATLIGAIPPLLPTATSSTQVKTHSGAHSPGSGASASSTTTSSPSRKRSIGSPAPSASASVRATGAGRSGGSKTGTSAPAATDGAGRG